MIKIINAPEKTIKMRCRYCNRIIFREDEPNGTFKRINGKVICPMCRIMKLSKFKGQILEDKEKYKKDKIKQEEYSKKNAIEKSSKVAIASQKRAGEKYRKKYKKTVF